jgi:hypothetical protein
VEFVINSSLRAQRAWNCGQARRLLLLLLLVL